MIVLKPQGEARLAIVKEAPADKLKPKKKKKTKVVYRCVMGRCVRGK